MIYTVPNAYADVAWSVGSQLSSIKADGDNVYILWQNNSPDQNIYFKRSTDNGNSFGNTIRISNISEDPSVGFGIAANGIMAVPMVNTGDEINDTDQSGKYVYIAWMNQDRGNPHSRVLFRVSSDGGDSFSDPVSLTDSNFRGDSGIQELFASGNNVYAVLINEWADENNVDEYYYDLILRVSRDNGKTFGDPVHLIPNLLTRNVRAGLSFNVFPFLDSNSESENGTEGNNKHNDAVYVVWIDYGTCSVEQVTCEDIKIFFRKSTDDGKTFSNPIEIERPKEALDYDKTLRSPEPMYLQVAGSSDGKNVYVVWAEYLIKEDSQRIFLARSDDGGLTFSNPIDLSKRGVSESPRLIVPSYFYTEENELMRNASITNEGTVYFAWKFERNNDINNSSSFANRIPGIVLVKSSDSGITFSQPVSVTLKMTGPFWDIAASQNGNQLFVTWENQTENLSDLPEGIDVYFRGSHDGGETFGNVQDLTDDNALKTFLAAQKKPLSFVASQIVVSQDGKNVYAAWQMSYPDSTAIYVRASEDAGQSFGRIISLNDQTADPISGSIAGGSSNLFFGPILTPIGLTVSSIGITIAGVVAFLLFRSRKRK